jgi:hypothetical protein
MMHQYTDIYIEKVYAVKVFGWAYFEHAQFNPSYSNRSAKQLSIDLANKQICGHNISDKCFFGGSEKLVVPGFVRLIDN